MDQKLVKELNPGKSREQLPTSKSEVTKKAKVPAVPADRVEGGYLGSNTHKYDFGTINLMAFHVSWDYGAFEPHRRAHSPSLAAG